MSSRRDDFKLWDFFDESQRLAADDANSERVGNEVNDPDFDRPEYTREPGFDWEWRSDEEDEETDED